jgi:hypothetical protein
MEEGELQNSWNSSGLEAQRLLARPGHTPRFGGGAQSPPSKFVLDIHVHLPISFDAE